MENVIIFAEKPYTAKQASMNFEAEINNNKVAIKPCEQFPNGARIVTGIGIIQDFLGDLYVSDKPVTNKVLKDIVHEIETNQEGFNVFSSYEKERFRILKESFETADLIINFCPAFKAEIAVLKILYACTGVSNKKVEEVVFHFYSDVTLESWNNRKEVNEEEFFKVDSRLETIVTFIKENMQ